MIPIGSTSPHTDNTCFFALPFNAHIHTTAIAWEVSRIATIMSLRLTCRVHRHFGPSGPVPLLSSHLHGSARCLDTGNVSVRFL